MSSADADAEFTGKYESSGRISRWLVDRFYDGVRQLLVPALQPGDRVMEVGSGAGYSAQRLVSWLQPDQSFLGSDVGASLVAKARLRNPDTTFVQQSVYDLAVPDKSVDVVVMLEVLEHLERPEQALIELRRVARRRVVLSTPREPIWCALNLARGKYMRDWGNTPGHIQHWTSRGLRRAAGGQFRVLDRRQPLPWTILLLEPRPE